MSSIFGGVRTVIIYNPHFVADVPPQARDDSRKKHRSRMWLWFVFLLIVTNNSYHRYRQSTTHQGAPSTSVLNNDLTTSTNNNNNGILPSLTHSGPHQQQQPLPSSSQGVTTANRPMPVVLEAEVDFPICDDRSEIDPDDNAGITSNNHSSSSFGTLCMQVMPPDIPNRKRNQKTRREAEDSTKVESSFAPSSPQHTQLHPKIESSQEQKQKKRHRRRKHERVLPMPSNEELSVPSGSPGAVHHLKSRGGPLFALLSPSPAPSASSSGSSCATSSSRTSTATSTTSIRRK